MYRPESIGDTDAAVQDPALLQWALALTKDPAEAQALVDQTLATARAEGRSPDRAVLFRTFRQAYHSVARGRSRRSMRDASVTALARAPGEALAVQTD